jgi:TRAP-type mannitol/chloroaromatic compound transport system permease small subunit
MQLFGRVISLMNGAGVVWIFALMFLICADIFGRTVFDTPVRGVAEMVSLSLVASVFLQLAYAVQQQRLTRAEFLFNRVQAADPKLASDWSGVLSVFAFAMFLVIAIGIYPDFIRAFRTAEFAGVQGIFAVQVWPIKLLIFLGALAAAFDSGRRAIEEFRAEGESSSRGLALIVPALVLIATVLLATSTAEPRLVGAAMIAMVLALITLGMPIAIALLLTGFLGLVVLKQDVTVATRTVALAADGTISEYVLPTERYPNMSLHPFRCSF